jgi:two-component system, OmpR family, sensor histidine kinase MtrB
VQDMTAALDLEARREEFLRLVTRDLRGPLAALLAQGANLEANAAELPTDQVARMGGAIRNQAERISRLADDLHDVTRLATSGLALAPRPVDLASVVHAALASVPAPRDVEVRIPFGVEVLADARRLEQVVANLVENGLSHGAPPVVINLDQAAEGRVDVSITDQGDGLDPTLASTLLVHGLVEAMGGSVGYQRPAEPGDCARLVLSLPQPGRPPGR